VHGVLSKTVVNFSVVAVGKMALTNRTLALLSRRQLTGVLPDALQPQQQQQHESQ